MHNKGTEKQGWELRARARARARTRARVRVREWYQGVQQRPQFTLNHRCYLSSYESSKKVLGAQCGLSGSGMLTFIANLLLPEPAVLRGLTS